MKKILSDLLNWATP